MDGRRSSRPLLCLARVPGCWLACSSPPSFSSLSYLTANEVGRPFCHSFISTLMVFFSTKNHTRLQPAARRTPRARFSSSAFRTAPGRPSPTSVQLLRRRETSELGRGPDTRAVIIKSGVGVPGTFLHRPSCCPPPLPRVTGLTMSDGNSAWRSLNVPT